MRNGGDYINDTFEASQSDPITLIVQEEKIQPWPEAPLPTQFWTRPINSANRDWYVLAGNWLAGAAQYNGPTTRFNYGTGPESPHVMWVAPIWSGGIMDARYGATGYQTEHYEGLDFAPPIILDGHIYYNVQSLPREGWWCMDLYTGEYEYFHNTTGPVTGVSDSSSGSIAGESLAFGQIYNYESPNQHGGMPYLWSINHPTQPNTWMMFDAYTGNYICSINNVPGWVQYGARFVSGVDRSVYGKDGSILSYNIVNLGTTTNPAYYLQCWNTSRAIWYRPFYSSNSYWLWRPGLNVTFDGRNGFSLNASIPDMRGASIYAIREDKYVIVGTPGKNNGTYVLQGWLAALNLKPDSIGVITPTLLWNITYTPPQAVMSDMTFSASFGGMNGPIVDPEDGVFIFNEGMTRRWWGYSLETGQQIWGPTAPEPQMNFYTSGTAAILYNIYQGKLLSAGWGGVLTAYDIKTGKQLWNYTAAQVGFESPYGNYPIYFSCVADGKLYMISGEHSPSQPLWRGPNLRCINASNGAELWKILFQGQGAGVRGRVVIADGFLVGLNFYDNQIYCFGKGPSATTVDAPMTAITAGNTAVIRGMVTDQCTGAKKLAEKLGFVNGVPAVSDESMQAWMEYLYMQQARPSNATGVEVSLDALDPNGNFVHLGTATSDTTGLYSLAWTTPAVPGKYTVIASFTGSKSYYGSYAETAIYVDEAPPPTAPPEYPQPIDPTWTIVGVGIAIIMAVVLVGFLTRRK